jgi:hypothetical protein
MSRNTTILSVKHHRQNPVDSTSLAVLPFRSLFLRPLFVEHTLDTSLLNCLGQSHPSATSRPFLWFAAKWWPTFQQLRGACVKVVAGTDVSWRQMAI